MRNATMIYQMILVKLLLLRCCFSLVHRPVVPVPILNHDVAYASYWERLLLEEHDDTVKDLRERRKQWSRQKLESTGLSIFGATAEPDSEAYGEKIVRIVKVGETLLQDRFTRGDVLLLTPLSGAEEDCVPRECLIIDVGKDWMTAGVGPNWPDGLWEARKYPGAFQVRLDRTAPQAPLRAQRKALDLLRKGKAGEVASLLARFFDHPNGSEQLANLTSRMPSHFSSTTTIEKVIWDALDATLSQSSFKPNQSQKDVIVWSLQRRISLIRGPPGTGKTTVAALLISTALRLPMDSASTSDNVDEHTYKKARVLAVAHSNGAADVLIEALLKMGVPAVRLGRPASVSPSVQHRTIPAMTQKLPDVIKLRQMAYDLSLDSQTRSAAAYELTQSVNDMKQTIIEAAPVVVTSCIGAHQLLETGIAFPIVILDEAAQTTEPALVCALASAKASQVILVGDTRQLPPTVTSAGLRDTLGVSPMARLENAGVDQQTLRLQYRMPPFLLEHPSRYFYDGLVSCAPGSQTETLLPSGFPWPDSQPLAFIQVGNDSEVTHSFGGKSNPTEAELVADIVSDLLEAGDVGASDIAVITPYSKQVQLIRSELSNLRKAPTAQHIRIGTVDSFQGQEVNIVIFSSVRSNPMNELGFLRDARRLCVAITRAKRGIILVGDQTTLRSCRHWGALLDSCEARGCTLDRRDLEQSYTLASSDGIADVSVIDEVLQELFDKSSDDLYGLF